MLDQNKAYIVADFVCYRWPFYKLMNDVEGHTAACLGISSAASSSIETSQAATVETSPAATVETSPAATSTPAVKRIYCKTPFNTSKMVPLLVRRATAAG